MFNLPRYEQLRHYYCVMQHSNDLPVALFLLEVDAIDWINQQESKDIYSVQKKA